LAIFDSKRPVKLADYQKLSVHKRRTQYFVEGMRMRSELSFKKQMLGYRLATAEILYHLPDHPKLLQSYVWQDYDIAPSYPVLSRFLDFWTSELEGPIHSVRLAGKQIIGAAELRTVSAFGLN
jgi:uncharacterized protein Usg